MSAEAEQIWETYTSAWKVVSAREKADLLAASVAQECTYMDPLASTSGQDELVAYMVEFHKQFPGGHFVTKKFIAHNQRSISYWDMCDAEGNAVSDGASFGTYGDDGKLTSMTGFFEVPTE